MREKEGDQSLSDPTTHSFVEELETSLLKLSSTAHII